MKKFMRNNVKMLMIVTIFLTVSNKIQAQLSCDDKGYFYFKAYDPHSKTVYMSNIINGDAYYCSGGKKVMFDNKKVQIFRNAVKEKDANANTIMDFIIPNNYGSNRRENKLPNDFEAVKKEYETDKASVRSPDKIVIVTLGEEFFK